jgi:pyridoxal phosphate enzyme (YggS family)
MNKNLAGILERIASSSSQSGYDEQVQLVAVSKNVGCDEVKELFAAGQRAFGENRVQSLAQKAAALGDLKIEWHFIGRLQTNKINALLDLSPTLIHSCDSLELAAAIDKRAHAKGKIVDILLQINSAKEATKAGVEPDEVVEIYAQITSSCPNLRLKGVMSIGAHVDDETIIRQSFQTTRAIYEALKTKGFAPRYCSMGMSSDYQLAIKCGANILRIGSALYV